MRLALPPLIVVLPMLAGCFPWGSRAQHWLPEQTAFDRTYSHPGQVLIIGAGASGLAAARIFEDNGVDYAVLEASDHYGGRLGKNDEFADFPIDLGAEWIHNQAQILDVLSGVEGTAAALDPIPYRVKDTYYWDGTELKDASRFTERIARFFPEYKFRDSTWYDFASEHYGQHVEHRIQYGARVASIDHSGDRVKVTTTEGDVHEADQVLVTVSIGVLRSGSVTFIPPLSETKQAAIDAVPFHHGFKAFFSFTEDFYPDYVLYETDEGEMGFYDAAFGKDTEDHVLGALVVGPFADEYYGMPSKQAIADALIGELDHMFDGRASKAYTGDFIVIDWGRDPHFLGTWVEGFRLSKQTVRALNEPLDGKVYFAGEATDTYHQLGVPGAMLSGLHAADRMLTEAQ